MRAANMDFQARLPLNPATNATVIGGCDPFAGQRRVGVFIVSIFKPSGIAWIFKNIPIS
jgi:hypothetical protein